MVRHLLNCLSCPIKMMLKKLEEIRMKNEPNFRKTKQEVPTQKAWKKELLSSSTCVYICTRLYVSVCTLSLTHTHMDSHAVG